MDERSHQLISKAFDQRERSGHGVNVMCVIAIAGYSELTAKLGPNARSLFTSAFHERVRSFCRATDVAIEWEESRAIVLLRDIGKMSQLELAGNKLQRDFEMPITVLDDSFDTDVRAAFVVPTKAVTQPEELLEQADRTLRQTSDRQPCLAVKLGADQQQSTDLPTSTEIKSALEAGEFELWGIPIVHASFNNMVGAETALYWRSREYGRRGPSDYLSTLVQDHAVKELYWATLRQGAAFLAKSEHADNISIHIPNELIKDGDLLPMLKDTWAFYDLELDSLNLKLKHSPSPSQVNKLREVGVKICLDDFGGRDGIPLSELGSTPADILVLSEHFAYESEQDHDLLAQLTKLAALYNLQVRASAVADQEALEVVKKIQIREATGPLFGHWQPARDISL